MENHNYTSTSTEPKPEPSSAPSESTSIPASTNNSSVAEATIEAPIDPTATHTQSTTTPTSVPAKTLFYELDPTRYESVPFSMLEVDNLPTLITPRSRVEEMKKPVRKGSKPAAPEVPLVERELLLLSTEEVKELLDLARTYPAPLNAPGAKKGLLVFDFYRTPEGERIWYQQHIWGAFWQSLDSPNCSTYILKNLNNFDFLLVADGWRNSNALKFAKELMIDRKASHVCILKESYDEFATKYPEHIWKRLDFMKYLQTEHQGVCPAVEVIPNIWQGSDRDVPDFMGPNDYLIRIRNTEERSKEMRLDIEFQYEKFENYHNQAERTLFADLPTPDSLDDVIGFIDRAEQKNGRVLVHCASGMFSSPAVIVAYLIRRKHKTYKEAYTLMEEKRPWTYLFHLDWDRMLKSSLEAVLHQKEKEGDLAYIEKVKEDGPVLSLNFTGYWPTPILSEDGGLYLGGVFHAVPPVLRAKSISHVLTVADDVSVSLPDEFNHKVVSLSDLGDSDLSLILDDCADFIKGAMDNRQSVLVHCKIGVNRSVSVLVSFLMRYRQMSLRQALHYVRARRSILNPVHEYLEQLIRYELKVHGKSSIAISEYDDFLLRW